VPVPAVSCGAARIGSIATIVPIAANTATPAPAAASARPRLRRRPVSIAFRTSASPGGTSAASIRPLSSFSSIAALLNRRQHRPQ
jgi:hypothetical protein